MIGNVTLKYLGGWTVYKKKEKKKLITDISKIKQRIICAWGNFPQHCKLLQDQRIDIIIWVIILNNLIILSNLIIFIWILCRAPYATAFPNQ